MKLIAMASMLLLIAGNALADDDDFTKWRVGGSLSYADYDAEFSQGRINNGGVGFKLHAQYRLTSWLGLEGAYYVSPQFTGDLTPEVRGGEAEATYQGTTLHAIGYLPSPVERMDFFVKGGYFNFDYDLKVDGDTNDSGKTDGLSLGIGTAIDAGDDIGIRIEFDWYDVSGTADLWTIGIGAEYRF